MELKLQTAQGTASSAVDVSDGVFAVPFNEPLIHQVVTAYLAAARAGTKAQKTRAEVSGGGKKPWRQKGTGRARAGTTRGPIWRGGGRTFAARPQDHEQKVNRKMYRGAMRSILSELIRQDRLIVVDDIKAETPKTRELVASLKGFGLDDVLIVLESLTENMYLASRNLHWVGLVEAATVDPVSLVGFEKILITVGAVRQIEERLV